MSDLRYSAACFLRSFHFSFELRASESRGSGVRDPEFGLEMNLSHLRDLGKNSGQVV
jgi:hypothetical protein